jgi:hypothetical protein
MGLTASLRPDEKSEDENMYDEQGWHDRRWNEECGTPCAGIDLNPEALNNRK